MDASLLKSTRGRNAFKPGKNLREALRARGKNPGNITFFFGPKANTDWIVASDIELGAALLSECDPNIVWYQLETARITVELGQHGFKGSVPDQIFQRYRGGRGMLEAKHSVDVQKDARAARQKQIQSTYAEEIGYTWQWFTEVDAEQSRVKLMNWLAASSVLFERRFTDTASLQDHIEQLVRQRGRCTLLDIRKEVVSDWQLAFVAVMRLHMSRRVLLDLSFPFSWQTDVREPHLPAPQHDEEFQEHRSTTGTNVIPFPNRATDLVQIEQNSAQRLWVDHLSGEVRARYARLEAAIDLFREGIKPGIIAREYGVSRQELHHYHKRFNERLPDGSLAGYRALVQGWRTKEYTRVKPALNTNVETANAWGYSGALQKCFRDHPKAKEVVDAGAKGKFGDSIVAAGVDLQSIHRAFLNALRNENVPANEWPFGVNGKGYAALARYVSQLARSSTEVRQNKFGMSALDAADGLSGKRSWLRSLFACDIVSYDEQTLPWFGTLRLDFDGVEKSVPIERCSLCLLTSEHPHTILAYRVSYRRRVAAVDLLAAFTVFLTKWTRRVLCLVPRLEYLPGAGFPSMLEGFLDHIRLVLLRVDGDLTHSANVVVQFLRQHLGLHVQFGAEGRWITRIIVEQVFNELQRRFARVPSNTGSGPSDPKVRNPAAAAVELDIRMDELLEVFEVVCANWNATPTRLLRGATPLEAMSSVIARLKEFGSPIPGYSRRIFERLPLPADIVKKRIAGNLEKSLSPHIHLDDANYRGDWLAGRWDLIGKWHIVHLQHDHRWLRVFTLDGRELGVLECTGHWSWTAHDRATRLMIIAMKNVLGYGPLDDPILVYARHLKERMAERARTHPTKVAREANKLLRLGVDLSKTATGVLGVSTQEPTQFPISPPPRSRGGVWLGGGTLGDDDDRS